MTPSIKPSPRLFIQALDALRVSPQDALFVGDSLRHDVRGARAVGLRTVWIRGRQTTPNEADYVIDDEKFIESLYEQTFMEITIDGELHEGWGAGPILAFFGGA